MFDTKTPIGVTPDALEQELLELEALIGRLRQRQLGLLHQADIAQVATADGARSLHEWTAARLDLTHETASQLVTTMRTITPTLNQELADGNISFDRATATSRLAAAGADEATVVRSRGHDLAGVRRLASLLKRVTPMDEDEAFCSQYLVIQPSLDESHWRVHGQLAGFEGRVVEKAIHERADQLRGDPDEPQLSTSQRRALALATIAQDSLEEHHGDLAAREPIVTAVVDASIASAAGGEAGARLAGGPRIGRRALDELICTGRIEWNAHTADGSIVALGQTTSGISPRLRRAVIARDGGCTMDACESRYRLEAHHVVPRSRGGADTADNLTTLCWWHHIVAIHRMGLVLDPDSPPHRRRFLRRGADPPSRQ